MPRATLYSDENPQVNRKSSINQYGGFFAVKCQGGWTPIVFDQLDGVNCQTVNSHPIVLSFTNDVGYHFPEARCSYTSEKFIYADKEGVEQKLLPSCFGGSGEFFEQFIREYTFVNFDCDNALGVRNTQNLRVGLSYVLADETLPTDD